MRIVSAIAALGFSAALLSSTPVLAQSVITKVTPQQFVSAMQQAGMKAEIKRGNNNSVYGLVDMAGGRLKAAVYFYGCNNQGCTSYTFTIYDTSKTLNVDFANAWNTAKRYAKASIDSEGDFTFEYDVDLSGGVTMGAVGRSAKLFDSLLGDLSSFEPGK